VVLDELAAAIEGLEVPADATGVRRLVTLSARLSMLARVGVARLDAVRGYEVDGHVAPGRWLEDTVGLDPRAARRLAATARKLAAFPALEAAAADGSVSAGQVEVVLEGIGRHRAAFAATGGPIVEALAGLSLADTAEVMAVWRELIDNEHPSPPDDTEGSDLSLARHFQGRVAGRFDLTADDGQDVIAALELADSGDRERPVAERRGDAFATVARFFLSHQGCVRPGRAATNVHVVVRPDELAAGEGGQFLDGTPVDDLDVAACDAVLHRLTVTEAGIVLAHGRSQRLFTDEQRRLLGIRDGGCRFPGCDRPASWADAHHVQYWERGGPTDIDNGVLLCRRHHRLVHRAGLELELLPDATLRVTGSDGRMRTSVPALRRRLEPRGTAAERPAA
jgi:hypothetical protein